MWMRAASSAPRPVLWRAHGPFALRKEFCERLPVVRIPAVSERVAIAIGETAMIELEPRLAVLCRQMKGSNGKFSGHPTSGAPGLHQPFVRQHFNMPPVDIA